MGEDLESVAVLWPGPFFGGVLQMACAQPPLTASKPTLLLSAAPMHAPSPEQSKKGRRKKENEKRKKKEKREQNLRSMYA